MENDSAITRRRICVTIVNTRTVVGGEDYDDSSLDSDEEERERRGPIACGYDITAAGEI